MVLQFVRALGGEARAKARDEPSPLDHVGPAPGQSDLSGPLLRFSEGVEVLLPLTIEGDAKMSHAPAVSRRATGRGSRFLGRPGRLDCRALRRTTLIQACCALALCAAVVAGCGGGGSSSESTTTAALNHCNINGKQRNLGASYVTSIEVATVSCGQAEKVILAYHRCRQSNGGAGGTCKSAVVGFTCTEGSRQEVPGVQYYSSVDCRKGDAEIKSAYTQNL